MSDHRCPDCPYCDYQEFNVGDKVQRKMFQAFRYDRRIGEIVEVLENGRAKIKWTPAASTGQQHSTVQLKFIQKVKT